MKKELKEKLEAKLLSVGLDKGLSAILNIEKEEEIEGAVSNLVKLKTPEQKLEDLLKKPELQSEIDRRVSEAKKKWEEKTPPKPPTPPVNGALTPEAIAELVKNAVATATEPLTGKLGEFEANKAREAKISQARLLLKDSKIPESVMEHRLKYLDTSSETPLEDWVKVQEEEHESYHQSLVDSGLISTAPAQGYNPTAEMSEQEAQAIVDRVKV